MPSGVYERTAETRAILSAAHKGKASYVRTPETRAKHSAASRARWARPGERERQGEIGRAMSPEARAKVGAARRAIKGDEVGYNAVHQRARRVLPKECLHCGKKDGRLEAALDHPRVAPENLRHERRFGRLMAYSINISDYIRLCVPCHRAFDYAEGVRT